MHELSIALSIIERIEEEAAKHSGKVRSAQVRLGVLSGVDSEALKFAWEIARAGTDLESAELEIEKVPLLVYCPACGRTYSPDIQALFCPECITPAQDVLSGKELELTTLEIDG